MNSQPNSSLTSPFGVFYMSWLLGCSKKWTLLNCLYDWNILYPKIEITIARYVKNKKNTPSPSCLKQLCLPTWWQQSSWMDEFVFSYCSVNSIKCEHKMVKQCQLSLVIWFYCILFPLFVVVSAFCQLTHKMQPPAGRHWSQITSLPYNRLSKLNKITFGYQSGYKSVYGRYKISTSDGTILVLKKSWCETIETAKVRNGEGAKWPALNAGLEEENNRKYFFFYKYKVYHKKLTTFPDYTCVYKPVKFQIRNPHNESWMKLKQISPRKGYLRFSPSTMAITVCFPMLTKPHYFILTWNYDLFGFTR